MESSSILRKICESRKKTRQDTHEDLISVGLVSVSSDRSFPSSTNQPNKSEGFSGFPLSVALLLRTIYILWVFQWLCSPLVDFYIFGFFSAPKSRAGKKGDGFREFNKESALLCCQQLWIVDIVSQLYEIYTFYFTVHKEKFFIALQTDQLNAVQTCWVKDGGYMLLSKSYWDWQKHFLKFSFYWEKKTLPWTNFSCFSSHLSGWLLKMKF